MSQEKLLSGQVILITGATRGLGRAVAFCAAVEGATVVACGRDVRALEGLQSEIEQVKGTAPVLMPINLEGASLEDYQQMGNLLAERFGGLTGVFVNAAHPGELSPVEHCDAAIWARVFQVNVHSPFLMLKSLMHLFDREANPTLLFSLAPEGENPSAYWGAYAASKSALRALMKVCASEWSGFCRVLGILPPKMDTRLRFSAFPSENREHLVSPGSVAPKILKIFSGSIKQSSGSVISL